MYDMTYMYVFILLILKNPILFLEVKLSIILLMANAIP
jgi:hypothetical protein